MPRRKLSDEEKEIKESNSTPEIPEKKKEESLDEIKRMVGLYDKPQIGAPRYIHHPDQAKDERQRGKFISCFPNAINYQDPSGKTKLAPDIGFDNEDCGDLRLRPDVAKLIAEQRKDWFSKQYPEREDLFIK